jgi:hypothetical protein
MNADLHTFVREALARGASRDSIRAALRDARWAEDEIESALAAWHDAGLGIPVPRRRVAFSAREAFLYLLMFVALYMVAYHTGAILFALVEFRWPDAAFGDSTLDRMREWVRFGVASLLVAFPVFLLTSRITGRAVAEDPEKRNSGVRRWLTYLTLFNAACVLIGDFIAVLLGLLKGELTARFLSKAGIVAAIAGWLFTHYMGGLRRDEADAPRTSAPSRLARGAGLAVVVVTAVGMWLAGTPGEVRRQMLDQRRLRELAELSQAIDSHHRERGLLPSDLDALYLRRAQSSLPLTDPVTHDRYAYSVLDSVRYELCATFDAADSLGPHDSRVNPFWRHGPGHACFTFEVARRREP